MSRAARVRVKGVWYHVTNRGIDRRAIFKGGVDEARFLEFLGQLPERYGFKIHGYVLMGNHYHLLIEDPEFRISEGMKWLNLCYGMSFNRRHERVGPLFQGRFKAVILDPQERGLSVSRYVHLNPVRVRALGVSKREAKAIRAGKRSAPELIRERLGVLRNYPWSSYRAYVGLDRTPKWLTTEFVNLKAGGKVEYRKQVEKEIREGMEEKPWEAMVWGLVLGGKALQERVKKKVQGNRQEQTSVRAMEEKWSWESVVDWVEKVKGEKWVKFYKRHGDWGRDLVLLLMRERGRMTLEEMGKRSQMTGGRAVTAALKRMRARLDRDKELNKVYETLKSS